MPKSKNYKPLIALAALAVAAMVASMFTFTNVTYWVINATRPPVSVDLGDDPRSPGTGDYIKVDTEYDPTTGRNITRISIVAFRGVPTEFASALKLCNRYGSGPMQARLIWQGRVGTTGHESYIRTFYVYGPGGQKVGFDGATTYNTAGPFTINVGSCIDLGAYVLVSTNLPDSLADGRTILARYQIDIEISTS
jgi:hypothetical protein